LVFIFKQNMAVFFGLSWPGRRGVAPGPLLAYERPLPAFVPFV